MDANFNTLTPLSIAHGTKPKSKSVKSSGIAWEDCTKRQEFRGTAATKYEFDNENRPVSKPVQAKSGNEGDLTTAQGKQTYALP